MIYGTTVSINVADGLTISAKGVIKFNENRMEATDHSSIIWFDYSRIGRS